MQTFPLVPQPSLSTPQLGTPSWFLVTDSSIASAHHGLPPTRPPLVLPTVQRDEDEMQGLGDTDAEKFGEVVEAFMLFPFSVTIFLGKGGHEVLGTGFEDMDEGTDQGHLQRWPGRVRVLQKLKGL